MSSFEFSDKDKHAKKDTLTDLAGMIDLETLGTVSGSPIVTIGAVVFNPYVCNSTVELVRRGLLLKLDLSDTIDLSQGVEGKTIRWWFEQKDEAIKSLVGEGAISVKEALRKLYRYFNDRGSFVNEEFFPGLADMPKCSTFWAKDPDFDMVLLRYYYEKLGEKLPWDYYACRSVRTVEALAWEDPSNKPEFIIPGVAHNALWDSVHQAMRIQAAMKELNRTIDAGVAFKNWDDAKEKKE